MQREKTDITIIGAGLTGLSLAYSLVRAGRKVRTVEKQDRAGGVIETRTTGRFTYEIGPNTGVIGSPELVELFDELGDSCLPVTGNPEAAHRWIWKKGGWHALPSGPLSAIDTPLFSFYDKLRILLEPFRKPGTDPNESVAAMVRRRMGKSYLNYAVDPFISGVYAGDPERLITRFALPKLYHLEQGYGSFIRGAIKKRKEPKTDLEKRVNRKVFSVEGGLQNLIHALTDGIGSKNILLNCQETEILPEGKAYKIRFVCDGQPRELLSDQVVTTVGAFALPGLLPFMDKGKLEAIHSLCYAKVVEVIVGFHRWEGKPLKAFGGLVPSREGRNMLGVLFPSSLFAGRAPEEGALLSFFLGGRRKPECIEETDEAIRSLIRRELSETLGCSCEPDLFEIYRYQHAIPQYELDSAARYEAIESIQQEYPGLILAGNIRDGIGMADRVKQARQIAKTLIS